MSIGADMMLQHSFGCENLTHIVGMGSAQQVHEACEVALRSYVVCLERSVEIVKVSPHLFFTAFWQCKERCTLFEFLLSHPALAKSPSLVNFLTTSILTAAIFPCLSLYALYHRILANTCQFTHRLFIIHSPHII